MRSTIHNGQSLPDVALDTCGSFESAFVLAERNGIALTDDLTPGGEVEYLPEQVDRRRIVAELSARGIRPATAISAEEAIRVPWGGIGLMGIEIDFKVS